nr:adenylate/guanylate cyclase domain-containing protein [uncultured Rhodopila sp.]
MAQLSVRSKIILTLLVAGLSCLAVGALIGYRSGASALQQTVEQQLMAQREGKRQRIESYIETQLRFAEALGDASLTVVAARDFIAAWHDTDPLVQADAAGRRGDSAVLAAWYENEFLPRINKVAATQLPIEGLMPADPVGRRVQADYFVRNSSPPNRPNDVVAVAGDSPYDRVHARYHQQFVHLRNALDFDDINIVDAATGILLYSTTREPDLGNSVFTGPYQRSGFAEAVRRALDLSNGGKPVIVDYDAYMPAGFAPQLFTAVPIASNGRIIAVLVLQIDIDELNDLLTDAGQWKANGQGETGEVLLVGDDHLLRSQARLMQTDPERFLAMAEADGVPKATIRQMRALGTTILSLPDRNPLIERALHNETGIGRFLGPGNVEVVAAYGSIEIAGLRWAILAKKDVSEAFAAARQLDRDLAVTAGIAAIVLTFVALGCAGLFLRPLRRVVAGMRTLEATLAAGRDPAPIDVLGNDEFSDLAEGHNQLAAEIAARGRRIAAAERKADAMLDSLYPAGVVARLRSGATITAESASNVTIIVTMIHGLDGAGVRHGAVEMSEVLSAVLNALNATAAAHGVETVRSLGEIHVAACGLSSPRLDHAARALAWTRSATLAIRQVSLDRGSPITLGFGLASGEIDVLLFAGVPTGFDLWGHPLEAARRSAYEAQPGHVRVSESCYMLLNDLDGFQPCPLMEHPAYPTLRTWSRPAAATTAGDTSPPSPVAAEAAQ